MAKGKKLVDPIKNFEKELVAEQPGLAVGVTGLLIALFIGLALRTALAPEKVLQLVENAAKNIDARFIAHVGGAQISLSDGIFPELSVVVEDLSLESDEACWMRPTIEVDRLKLPVDFFKFLTGQIHIHEIYAGEVSLSLRSDMTACHNKETAMYDSSNHLGRGLASSMGRNSAGGQASPWESFAHSKDSIDYIKLDRMRIHYLPLTFTSFEIRQVEVSLNGKNPKHLSVTGILNLNGETLSGDYSSTASLNLDYLENRENDWNLVLDGHWREGRYKLTSDFNSRTQMIKLSTDMDQIPLNQIFPLLKKYRLLTSDFNGRQVWLSIKGGVEGPVAHLSSEPAHFDLIRIEGNVGEIEAKDFQVDKLNPFTFKPIDVEIKSLQLDALMTFLNRPHPYQTLGHLGVFHGVAHFEDSQNVKIKGDNTGLEFIFSSRGVRQLQPISLISGEIKFSQSKWNIKIDRVKPVEGVFLGDFNLEADHNWSKVSIKSKIDELTLGPSVQKLLTNGGEVGSINGDFQCRFDHGSIQEMSGNLTTADLAMDDLTVKRAKMSLMTKNQEVLADLRIQGAGVGKDSPVNRFLSQFLSVSNPNGTIDINHGSAKMRTKLLEDFHWDSLNLQSGSDNLRSQGGWSEAGKLDASIDTATSGGKSHHFNISGDRDRPLVEKVK